MSLDGGFKRRPVRDPLGTSYLTGPLSLDSDARILPCDREIDPPYKFADSVFRVASASWRGASPKRSHDASQRSRSCQRR